MLSKKLNKGKLNKGKGCFVAKIEKGYIYCISMMIEKHLDREGEKLKAKSWKLIVLMMLFIHPLIPRML